MTEKWQAGVIVIPPGWLGRPQVLDEVKFATQGEAEDCKVELEARVRRGDFDTTD